MSNGQEPSSATRITTYPKYYNDLSTDIPFLCQTQLQSKMLLKMSLKIEWLMITWFATIYMFNLYISLGTN